jgi:hypothetical protein
MRSLSPRSLFPAALAVALCLAYSPNARAADPERSTGWQTVTSITMVAGVATTALMPRIFYSDPEATVGWKPRWHVSVLAPTLTNVSLTLLNEFALKDALESYRPGCDETNQKDVAPPGAASGRCQDYGSLSSHSFLGFAALGQGGATFVIDTVKWSDGKFNVGAFVGDIAFPLVFAGITSAGRAAGNWEEAGTVVLSSVTGLVTGVLTGLTYAMLQRPECGYGGALICW